MSHDTSEQWQARAQARGHAVLRLSLNGWFLQPPGDYVALVGTVPAECHAELIALLERWGEEGKFGTLELEK